MGAVGYSFLAVREANWDRNREAFHEVHAPKFLSKTNSLLNFQLGSHQRDDPFTSYGHGLHMFSKKFEVKSGDRTVGEVIVFGYNDHPEAVACEYWLDIGLSPKSKTLDNLMALSTSKVVEEGGLRFASAGAPKDGVGRYYIGPSSRVLARLRPGRAPGLLGGPYYDASFQPPSSDE